MKSRFEGIGGRKRLTEVLLEQRLVAGDRQIADFLATKGTVHEVAPGEAIIEQGGQDDDLYLILVGSFETLVGGTAVNRRYANELVGEISLILPNEPRSATVKALERSLVMKVEATHFGELADRRPVLWKRLAKETATRILQRNRLIGARRTRPHVFIVSSSEALGVAQAVKASLREEPIDVVVWSDGVFGASQYPIESLERELDQSDFGVAIAKPDDITHMRDSQAPTPRDNVIFELGLFIGRLGRHRTLLIQPAGQQVRMPSDLAGLATLSYVPSHPPDVQAACSQMLKIVADLGPKP